MRASLHTPRVSLPARGSAQIFRSGSVGASKSFNDHREGHCQPRNFVLLGNCQAICLPYDGVQSRQAVRVY